MANPVRKQIAPNLWVNTPVDNNTVWVSSSSTTSITQTNYTVQTTSGGIAVNTSNGNQTTYGALPYNVRLTDLIDQVLKIIPGVGEIHMPDGSKLIMDKLGNYKIEDKDAKVIYEANHNREFNRYVNASELLGKFIEDLGKIGVKQDKVLKIPVEYFINWLIHMSAEQDNDFNAADGVPRLEDSRPKLIEQKPQCLCCGRFIKKENHKQGINFCGTDHMAKYAAKRQLAIN